MTVLRQHLLEESSDAVELSEAFGQSEALTTRLKHIIGANMLKIITFEKPYNSVSISFCNCIG